MTATEHVAGIDRCTDVDAVQQRYHESEGVGDEEPATGSKTASGSNKKKKKKKKSSPGVLIYKNLVGSPFKVTESATVGRCVVAAKDIEAGEMILYEPPFAKVYCSRACKDQDAVIRATEANAVDKLDGISAARDVDLDLLRMVLRLLVVRAMALGLLPQDEKGQHGAEATEEESNFLREQWHNVRSLMGHREKMASEWTKVVRAAAEDLMDIVPAWVRSEVDEAIELACRVNVNAHGIRDYSGRNNIVGFGLFPMIAMINHSCRPNSTFLFIGGRIEIRALEAIKAGTEVNVHYIDLLQSTSNRRRELLTSKHFICCCFRCENPSLADMCLDSACCLDCGQDGCLTSTPPQDAEDVIAAQLAELNADVTKPGRSTVSGGRVSNKMKTPSGPKGGSGKETGSAGADDGSTGTVMFCSSCGRQYPTVAVEESVSRAKLLWKAAMATPPSSSKKALEKWLQDFDAGYVVPPSTHKKPSKKIKLHPGNAMVIQALIQLANCCNMEKAYSATTKHLKRAISAMEGVLPANYPELGYLYAAVADALTALIDERGEAMPRKTKNQTISERNKAMERAASIKSICLGPEHPSTKKLMRALNRC